MAQINDGRNNTEIEHLHAASTCTSWVILTMSVKPIKDTKAVALMRTCQLLPIPGKGKD